MREQDVERRNVHVMRAAPYTEECLNFYNLKIKPFIPLYSTTTDYKHNSQERQHYSTVSASIQQTQNGNGCKRCKRAGMNRNVLLYTVKETLEMIVIVCGRGQIG